MFRKLQLIFRGPLFCFFFNVRAFIKKIPTRFYYNKNEKIFYAKDGNKKMYFYHRKQSLYAYNKGMRARIDTLEKDYFLDKIKFKKNDIIIDCGANIGDFSLFFTFHRIKVRYFGYEPSPLEYSCLKKNVIEGKVFNIGLWNKVSKIDFFVSSENADSSFLIPNSYEKKITSTVKRLDSIFNNNKIKLLKLEGEGGEPEIIYGSSKILKNIEFITADLGFERGVKQESTFAEVTNYLLKNNFILIELSTKRLTALYKNILFK